MNYYRRYVGDYLRDTSRLSMLEHGAYNLLLDYYYADEKPLPIERQDIYLVVRAMTPADRKAVDKVLAVYFTQEPDGWHQKRVDHEIEVSRKARTNGKGGGRPPGGSGTGSLTGTVTGEETESETGQQTGGITGEGGGSGHPPTSNHHPPASSLQPPASNPQPEARAEARATRLPRSWALPVEWGAWAIQERGWTPDQVRAVSQRFHDHWLAKAGKDGRKLDWQATWRNWVRNERLNGSSASSNQAAAAEAGRRIFGGLEAYDPE